MNPPESPESDGSQRFLLAFSTICQCRQMPSGWECSLTSQFLEGHPQKKPIRLMEAKSCLQVSNLQKNGGSSPPFFDISFRWYHSQNPMYHFGWVKKSPRPMSNPGVVLKPLVVKRMVTVTLSTWPEVFHFPTFQGLLSRCGFVLFFSNIFSGGENKQEKQHEDT